MKSEPVSGKKAPLDLKAAEAFFRENFERRGELGASLSVWRDGKEILSLAGGFADRQKTEPWSVETPVLVWSATKGAAAACVVHALEGKGISLDAPVSSVWPEFAQAGKESVTFAQLLSHQAGLPALDPAVAMLDHAAAAEALAGQAPQWTPGKAHGYHPRTLGPLLEETVRRVAGMPLGNYWQENFAKPLGLDFWIGLPPEQLERVAPIFPPKAAGASQRDRRFFDAFSDPSTLTARAFGSLEGRERISLMNTSEVRQTALPAIGGIGTATALAKFYAMLANGGSLDGIRYFGSIAPMATPLVNGFDRVLLLDTAFSAGWMHDPLDSQQRKIRQLFGPSLTAFGHPGAGGSHAFADPENGIAFAYVMNQMESGILPGAKASGIVEALYAQAK